MATIVVETGTGSATANSYLSEADLTTYATDRGITIAGTNAVLLIQAMDYLESKDFIGFKLSSDQALMWPRSGAVIDGFYFAADDIPQLLIDAQAEIALGIDGGVNPMANVPRETRSETVGPISVEYAPTAHAVTYLQAAETKLAKLVQAIGMAVRV